MQVVSAMEAVGVMELLTKFNSKPQNAKVGRRLVDAQQFWMRWR